MSKEATSCKSAKDIVKEYLDQRASEDAQFAASYAKPDKSIDQCWMYILGEARNRGAQVCMTQEEVFGLAIHYYDEDDIKVKPVGRIRSSCEVQASPAAKLTAKEKAAVKEEARRIYQQQCLAEQHAANRKVAKKKHHPDPAAIQTPSLFDEI